MLEDDGPRKRPARLTRHGLDSWDVSDLHDYIGELREEISRAEVEIDRKQSKRSAAEAVFRK